MKFFSGFPHLESCQLILWTQRTDGIQHKWGEIFITANHITEVTHTPSFFRLRPCWGTGGDGDQFVSVESVDHPGAYLRHTSYVICLHPVTPA